MLMEKKIKIKKKATMIVKYYIFERKKLMNITIIESIIFLLFTIYCYKQYP